MDQHTAVTETLRTVNPGAEKWLGVPIKCLDEGFIRLVDYMGSDASIVRAARVSYGSGTKKVSEDEGLIRYLMRHRHTTPFEMCELKFHVRVPMDAWRQWIRHRTANVNEYSTRYSIAIDVAQRTCADAWRLQSGTNKQGSGGYVDPAVGVALSDREADFLKNAREIYQDRIDKGVAREQARKDLPLSTYTEAYWKMDLHNLLHFLGLRMDGHAQLEIRTYANAIGKIVMDAFPMAYGAFHDYVLGGIRLSGPEKDFIATHVWPMNVSVVKDAVLKLFNGNKRETDEFLLKLERLGHLRVSEAVPA